MQSEPLSITGRSLAAVFALLMAAMAVLQLNDPDSLPWVLMYGYLTMVCLVSTFDGVYRLPAWIGLAVALVWAATLFPGVYELFRHHPTGDLFTGMSPNRPYVEEARESLGLLIGSGAMACLLLLARRARRLASVSTP